MLIRLQILLSILLLINGCNFQPMYGKYSVNNLQDKLSSIKFITENNRLGNSIRMDCNNLFNPLFLQGGELYEINLKVEQQSEPVVIYQNREITRYNNTVLAKYSLKDLQNNNILDKGEITMISSYDATSSQYATYFAEQDRIRNNVNNICQQLKHRIAAILIQN